MDVTTDEQLIRVRTHRGNVGTTMMVIGPAGTTANPLTGAQTIEVRVLLDESLRGDNITLADKDKLVTLLINDTTFELSATNMLLEIAAAGQFWLYKPAGVNAGVRQQPTTEY